MAKASLTIPASFKLANITYKVVFTDSGLKENILGECDAINGVIKIRPGLSTALTEHTFLHELSHAMCFALGWKDLNEDEYKIDALGGMLHQFFQTMKSRSVAS